MKTQSNSLITGGDKQQTMVQIRNAENVERRMSRETANIGHRASNVCIYTM
jgi:hypothetical protein